MITVKSVEIEIDGKATTVTLEEAENIVDALTRMFGLERHKPFDPSDYLTHPGSITTPSINPNPVWTSTGTSTYIDPNRAGIIGGGVTASAASGSGVLGQSTFTAAGTLRNQGHESLADDLENWLKVAGD